MLLDPSFRKRLNPLVCLIWHGDLEVDERKTERFFGTEVVFGLLINSRHSQWRVLEERGGTAEWGVGLASL